MTLVLLLLAQAQTKDRLPEMFALSDGAAWEMVESGEVTLERRPVKGSAFPEYRATSTVTRPVDELCASLFDFVTVKAHGELSARTLLKDGVLERVVYDRVDMPIVNNRDYAMTAKRTPPGAAVCEIHFWTTNAAAPKRADGIVRIEKLWGTWQVSSDSGRAKVSYTMYVDPAGSIPAMLVHSPQAKNVIDTLKSALAPEPAR